MTYVECHTKALYGESCHAECHYAEYHGALASALFVIKFIIVTVMIWSHFVVLPKWDLDAQQTSVYCVP